MEWLSNYWDTLSLSNILVATGIFLASVAISVLVVGVIIVRIPAKYFSSSYHRDFLPNTPWAVRWGAVILKNVVGFLLIIAGIIMLIGPGQGILTILIGLILMDIPGKRPLEARIIKRPAVLSAVNNLRKRFDKPPLVVDQ